MAVEVVGGLWTGSLALISDAGHMLTHALALGVSLAAILFAARKTGAERTFGNHRAEVLAALFNAVTLIVISGFILWEAYERLLAPEMILGWEMFGIALGGLVVNLVTALILHDVGHDDLNVRSAFLHMLGDTFSSGVIVIGAVVIVYTGWTWIDPVLSVVVCLVILIWAWGLTRDSVRILLEAAPPHIDIAELRSHLLDAHPLVDDITDLHLWTITSGMCALEATIRLNRDVPLSATSDVLAQLRQIAQDHFRISHSIFQLEPPDCS